MKTALLTALKACLAVALLMGAAIWALFLLAPAFSGWFPSWISGLACIACFIGSVMTLWSALPPHIEGTAQPNRRI